MLIGKSCSQFSLTSKWGTFRGSVLMVVSFALKTSNESWTRKEYKLIGISFLWTAAGVCSPGRLLHSDVFGVKCIS